jgi:hypothetical protein
MLLNLKWRRGNHFNVVDTQSVVRGRLVRLGAAERGELGGAKYEKREIGCFSEWDKGWFVLLASYPRLP